MVPNSDTTNETVIQGQASRSTTSERPTQKKAPKKIYIPIRIQTNALKNDDIAINATYISIEDLAKTNKSRDVEIRYLESIKSFRDKLKSSYSCSQDHCPMIRERLEEHQREHHQGEDHQGRRPRAPRERPSLLRDRSRHSQTKLHTTDVNQGSKGSINIVVSAEPDCRKSVAISPAVSILKKTSQFGCSDCQSMQNVKCVDFNHTAQSFDDTIADEQTQCMHQQNRNQETEAKPRSSISRQKLEKAIHKWFEDIPVYPNITDTGKSLRSSMINQLIDKIHDLIKDVTTGDYERAVKAEIDKFLNTLPMWSPGAKRDQDLHKEGIKNNLLKKIRSLRDNCGRKPSVKYVDDVVNTDLNHTLTDNRSENELGEHDKEKLVETEVLEWLMQIKFKESEEIGRTINIIDATDIFTKRLTPLLEKPSCSKNYKLILKGLIVDTLNDLPSILHYPKNKKCYLNRIAEDLANRLICAQARHKGCFGRCVPRERSMYQLAVCSKSDLKQSIMDGLNDCLQNVRIDQCFDIKEEITEILIDCLEAVRFKEDLEDKDELINNVIGSRSFEMSETQTSDGTIENVREFLAEDIIKNAEYTNAKHLVRTCHSSSLSVFTSEHELCGKCPVTSTPKQNTSRLNEEEIAYMDKLGMLIRNWMETLPRKFNGVDEQSFKEVIIKDLAGDIMDQLKLEQLAPKTSPDRDKFMFYIIFRWLFRFEVYEDLNDATLQIDDLVLRLHEIPVPTLTMPQRGNRQAMANIKHMEGDLGWKEEFEPSSSDVLEDEISIWMNEQPSNIYSLKDKDYQHNMVHELAETIKNKIRNKQQEKDLDNDLTKWLKIMLKSSEKDNIKTLGQNLKSKIMSLPMARHDRSTLEPMNTKVSKSFSTQYPLCNQKKDNKIETVSSSCFNCKCSVEKEDGKTSESDVSQDFKSANGNRNGNEINTCCKMKGIESTDSETSQTSKQSDRRNQKLSKNIPSDASCSSKDVKALGSDSSQDAKIRSRKVKNTQSSKGGPKKSRSDSYSSNDRRKPKASKSSKSPKKYEQKRNIESSRSPDRKNSKGTNKNQQIGKKSKSSPTRNTCECPPDRQDQSSSSYKPPAPVDPDRTLKEFIGTYMEHNNDIDDNTAKGAYGEILKSEFRKLDPPTRKELYDNYSSANDEFSPDRLGKELQYIMDISDWLKIIPIDGSFNAPHNKERTDFVNDLAKNIYEVEENRRNEPSAVDHDSQLVSTLTQYTEQLPILPDQTGNVSLMVNQLANKIVAGRTPMPCCMDTSLNSTGIKEQNISEFIDQYIRLNAGDIADDPAKLDAWSARILTEAKKIVRDSAEPSTLCKTKVYNTLVSTPIPEDESVRLFGLELDYAKEISEWMNNLPLLPITYPDVSEERVKMISDLAEKFAEKEKSKITNPDEPQSNEEVERYLNNWIQRVPIDTNRDVVIPLVTQQLLNRIEKVNTGPQEMMDQSTNTPKKTKSKSKSKTTKTCKPSCCSSGEKAGQLVVEAIETWSNSLPVKAENKEAEKSIKDGVARRLFQKVGDLSVDPKVMNDDLLYQEMLTEEVDQQLSSLPQSPDIHKKKENLKKNIVDKVMEAKNLSKESAAGENYKEQLETTIDASIPNPVYNKEVRDPGFEIYKNRLAEMFILENFDYGNDDVRLKYEKRIKKEIDQYCQDAQAKNAIPLSKEQIYSELYGALFKVPMPCESSAAEDVEEVKTRCVIADWFDQLPLQHVSGAEDLLKRENIQTMLTKRLKEIETKEKVPDDKMRKEISKWLAKLPLEPGSDENIDNLTEDLMNKLKSSKEERRRVPPSNSSVSKNPSKSKGILGTSQIAGPSSAGHIWASPPPSSKECCQPPAIPRRKAADIILEIVQNWCESLPFYENTQKSRDMNNVIREDLGTKIIIKICELNGDPQIFSDDIIYDYMLDDELEKIMDKLPICCDYKSTKDYKKKQLKEALNSVKPLIREERARHEYKKELNSTVTNVLKEPLDTTADKIALFNELREDIVDNFVQYHYNRDDDEGKQIYKAKLRDAVMKYFLEIQENPDEGVDPLIKQNQLLNELAKISIPNEEAFKDEVEEIRMKDEVNHFFEELALPDEDEEKRKSINNVKLSLAKRLNELEKSGHNCTNDAKMKKEIYRYLKKSDIDVGTEEIQAFVDNLKATKGARKALPFKKDDTSLHCANLQDSNQYIQNGNQNGFPNCSQPGRNSNRSSLQPGRASLNGNRRDSKPVSRLYCPQANSNSRSLGVTPVEYQGFGGGVAASSSPQANLPTANICPNRSQSPDPTSQGEGTEGKFTAKKQQRQKMSENEETDEECKCLAAKGGRKMRGRPRCVLRRSHFCDDCDGYGSMWIPRPPCRGPPGYFYY